VYVIKNLWYPGWHTLHTSGYAVCHRSYYCTGTSTVSDIIHMHAHKSHFRLLRAHRTYCLFVPMHTKVILGFYEYVGPIAWYSYVAVQE